MIRISEGKMQKGRRNEEKPKPENIPPNIGKVGIGGGEKSGPLNVPGRNTHKHRRKSPVYRIGPSL